MSNAVEPPKAEYTRIKRYTATSTHSSAAGSSPGAFSLSCERWPLRFVYCA